MARSCLRGPVLRRDLYPGNPGYPGFTRMQAARAAIPSGAHAKDERHKHAGQRVYREHCPFHAVGTTCSHP
jgi:hypothetical protein